MALPYTSYQALINEHIADTLANQVFRKHVLSAMLIEKAISFDGTVYTPTLEYGDETEAQFVARFGEIQEQEINPFTRAQYYPRMLAATLTISEEERLTANSRDAVRDIVVGKSNNAEKSVQRKFSAQLYTRTAVATAHWNSLEHLLGQNTTAVGGIDPSDALYPWWKANILLQANFATGSLTTEADLMDSTKDTYLKNIAQMGLAASAYITGEEANIIVTTRYLWDRFERLLDPQKTGSPLTEKLGAMGFSAIKYRESAIIADDDMVIQQTGDTDARMWFFNTEYLGMFFNPGAKFRLGDFVEAENKLKHVAKLYSFGNTFTTNRGAHCVVQGLPTPKAYSNPMSR